MHKGVRLEHRIDVFTSQRVDGYINFSSQCSRPPPDILYGSWVPWPGIARARRADLIAESQTRRRPSVGRSVGRTPARAIDVIASAEMFTARWLTTEKWCRRGSRRRATLHRPNLTRDDNIHVRVPAQLSILQTAHAICIDYSRLPDSGVYRLNPRPGLAGRINSSNNIPSGGPPTLPHAV